MNAETKHGGPVDVLAVMEESARLLWVDAGKDSESNALLAAKAAVAELIEALCEIADVTTPGDGIPNGQWINERATEALANIRSAP